jgi:GNAT superfamily N-acetyltransferase
MEKYNNSYFICLSGGTPIGYVGVVDNDLRICTHWDFKKNGVGTFMLSKIIEYYPNVDVKVLNSNKPSLNFFIKNKFKIINSDTNLSYLKYELQEIK